MASLAQGRFTADFLTVTIIYSYEINLFGANYERKMPGSICSSAVAE